MRRRAMFGRLLAGAAAFVVAPAVQVVAAPIAPPQPYTPMDDSNIVYISEQAINDALDRQFGPEAAEDYSRSGYAEIVKSEIRSRRIFEAMQADCDVRGCQIEQSPYVNTVRQYWYWHRAAGQAHPVDQLTDDPTLAEVEAWRRSLHEVT